MQRCHSARWYNGLKRSGMAGMPFRTTSVQNGPTWRTTQLISLLPVGCWSPMYCAWVSSGSRGMSQNCAPHSARHSGLPQTCSDLDTPWNFRCTTMAPLCSRTGLVGPVPKGRWLLSWSNRRYERTMTIQGVTPLLMSRTSSTAGSGRFWDIHRTHPIWIHVITISSPKWKNHCERPGTTQEMNLPVL